VGWGEGEGIEASRHRGIKRRKGRRAEERQREEFTWIYRMGRVREEERQGENREWTRIDANKKRIRIRNKRKNFSRRGTENAEKRRAGRYFRIWEEVVLIN